MAWYYVTRGSFWLDMTALLPAFVQVFALYVPDNQEGSVNFFAKRDCRCAVTKHERDCLFHPPSQLGLVVADHNDLDAVHVVQLLRLLRLLRVARLLRRVWVLGRWCCFSAVTQLLIAF